MKKSSVKHVISNNAFKKFFSSLLLDKKYEFTTYEFIVWLHGSCHTDIGVPVSLSGNASIGKAVALIARLEVFSVWKKRKSVAVKDDSGHRSRCALWAIGSPNVSTTRAT